MAMQLAKNPQFRAMNLYMYQTNQAIVGQRKQYEQYVLHTRDTNTTHIAGCLLIKINTSELLMGAIIL